MSSIKEKLSQIGLSKGQAVIYLSLLKLGTATVKEAAEDSGFHRTNIYDVIDELKEKGLVTYYKEGKSTYYQAVNPSNLSSVLEEKKSILEEALPQLMNLFTYSSDKVSVQVYRGAQGMKSAFNNIVKKKNIMLYGLNIQGQLRTELPIYSKQYYRKLDEKNIHYQGIYTREYVVKFSKHKIRYIHPKYATPVATHIYEDTILIQIWQPEMIAIEIKSKQIADSYKDNFNIIWKEASKKPYKIE